MPIEMVASRLRAPCWMAKGALADALGHHGRHRHVGLRHHDDEFLAAVAAGEIDVADRLADAQRKFAQDVVAGIVAVCR